jgi:hypothetical protein
LGYLLGNLYLKGVDPNLSQSRGIEDFGSLEQEVEQLKKPPNRVRFKGDLGAKSPATQQNPQENVLKTPPRKSQQRAPKITTKKDGKSNTQP